MSRNFRIARIGRCLSLLAGTAGCAAEPDVLVLDGAPKKLELLVPQDARVSVGQPVRTVIASRAPVELTPFIVLEGLPEGSTFADRGDGTGLFYWVPTSAQTGAVAVQILARAGADEARGTWAIQVVADADPDANSTPDPGPTPVNHAPSMNVPAELWLLTGFPENLQLSAVDPDLDSVTISLLSAPGAVTYATSLRRLYFNLQVEGAYSIVMRVSDGSSHTDYTTWIHVQKAGNYPPVFQLGATEITIPGGSAWLFPVSVSDANAGDGVALSVVGPSGMTVQWNTSLAWTPPHHGFGTAWVTLRAFDGVTVTTQPMIVHVQDAANSAPVVPNMPSFSAYQGGLVQFAAPAIDPEGDGVTYAVSATTAGAGSVGGISIDAAGNVTWRIPVGLPVGAAYVTVTAVDTYGAAGSRTKAGTIVLNAPPSISAGPVPQAVRNVSWTFSLSASDADLEAVSLELITGPTGMGPMSSANPIALQWIPVNIVGNVPFGVRAVDPHGASTYFTGMITVINRSPSFTATYASPRACIANPMAFTISNITDPDADLPAWSSDNGDVSFAGLPVSGGTVSFANRRWPTHTQIGITANDGFGGVSYESTDIQVFGWRDVPGIPNRVSSRAGDKQSFYLAPSTYPPAAGGFILGWEEVGASYGVAYDNITIQYFDQWGCPQWNTGLPLVVDAQNKTKALSGVAVTPEAALTLVTVASGGPLANCISNFDYAVAFTHDKMTGALLDSKCIHNQSMQMAYDLTRLTGLPNSASNWVTSLWLQTDGSGYSLHLSKIDVLANGIMSVPVNALLANSVGLNYVTSMNVNNIFYIVWKNTVYNVSSVVAVKPANGALLFSTVSFSTPGAASNYRVAAWDSNHALIAYSEGTGIKAAALHFNGSTGAIQDTTTLSTHTSAIGGDGDLLVRRGLNKAYYAWSKAGQIYIQAIDYDAASQQISLPWNGGNGLQVSLDGTTHRKPKLAWVDASVIGIVWEELDAVSSKYLPVARFVESTTGNFAGGPQYMSLTPSPGIGAVTSMGAGLGIVWPDYTRTLDTPDVALNWMDATGKSRPAE